LRASAAWFRLLLRCYPPDFRELAGGDVVEAYLDHARAAVADGTASLARVWLAAMSDALRNGSPLDPPTLLAVSAVFAAIASPPAMCPPRASCRSSPRRCFVRSDAMAPRR
jgi:hypothetical protein